jgi:hypothetical protein
MNAATPVCPVQGRMDSISQKKTGLELGGKALSWQKIRENTAMVRLI